jgi:hypothetical protein
LSPFTVAAAAKRTSTALNNSARKVGRWASQSYRSHQQRKAIRGAALDTLFRRPIPDHRKFLANTCFAEMQLMDKFEEGSAPTLGHLVRAYQQATNGFWQLFTEPMLVGLPAAMFALGSTALCLWVKDGVDMAAWKDGAAIATIALTGFAVNLYAHFRINHDFDHGFARVLQRVNAASIVNRTDGSQAQAGNLLAALPRYRVQRALWALRNMEQPQLARRLWAQWQSRQN